MSMSSEITTLTSEDIRKLNTNVLVCSMDELPRYKAIFNPTHIISALSNSEYHYLNYEDHDPSIKWLKLDFFDISDEVRGPYYGPSKEDVLKVLDFTKGLFESDARILVHCYAGISRSTALAFAILCTRYSPATSLRKLVEIRPIAFPNMRIVQFIDEIFKAKGEITDLIREFRKSRT